MALDLENYDPAVMYGASLDGDNLKPNSVAGASLTLGNQYITIATATGNAGNVAVNILGSGTITVAGSVTGFYAVNTAGTGGSAFLWGTSSGTIAMLSFGGTYTAFGSMVGTGIVTASAVILAGDTLQVSASNAGQTAGSYICYTTIKTAF